MAVNGHDAMRLASLSTKLSQFVGGQRAVDVAPRCSGLGVDVPTAEDHFQCSSATDQARKSLCTAAAGDDADGHLGMAEDRCAECGVTHVERHRELAAAAAGGALDDGDRGLREGPEPFHHGVERRERVVQREVVGGQVPDQPDVGVCDEELRIGRVHDEHTQRLIVGDLSSQAVDLADERHVEQVDRWIVDRRAADRTVDRDAQKPVVVVSHEQTV